MGGDAKPANGDNGEKAATPGSPAPLLLPPMKAVAGGEVLTIYGRGFIVEVLPGNQVKIQLTSWKLAGKTDKVLCYLHLDSVQIVSEKAVTEMSPTERFKHTQTLKTVGGHLLEEDRYGIAMECYEQAVSISTALLKEELPKAERADLLIYAIKNSNHVGNCCLHLEQFNQAIEWAESAVTLVDALERRAGGAGSTSPDSKNAVNNGTNPALLGQLKLFGECRCKAYMIMARALSEQGDKEGALKKLDDAQAVVKLYATPENAKNPNMKSIVKTFLSYQKKVKKLRRAIEQKDDPPKKTPLGERQSSWIYKPRRVWFEGEDKPETSTQLTTTADGEAAPSTAVAVKEGDISLFRKSVTIFGYTSMLMGGAVGTYVLARYLSAQRRR